jgi:hypothetical protein
MEKALSLGETTAQRCQIREGKPRAETAQVVSEGGEYGTDRGLEEQREEVGIYIITKSALCAESKHLAPVWGLLLLWFI